MLNDHDIRTFQQTAAAVVRFNKYMTGYTAAQMQDIMEWDAEMFMVECSGRGECGYASTRGYVLSTYIRASDGTIGCYASVSASLFAE